MKKASDYLSKQGKRKSFSPSEGQVKRERVETELILERLEEEGIETSMPSTRADCPSIRPCPFVGCVYNLYLDVTDKGTIKYNFWGVEPWEMRTSCVLDVAEAHPNGLSLTDIGENVGLTRERIRQIEREAILKLRENIGETTIKNWLESTRSEDD